MDSAASTDALAETVPENARIEDIADKVESSDQPFAVVDADGKRIGALGRQAIIDVLIGRNAGR